MPVQWVYLKMGSPVAYAVPITLMQALDGKGRRILGDGDGPTMEDPLAAVVETSSRGHALARDTRLTEVGRETTDDN